MKVEYPLHLFNNFNKQIWTNKIFSYFLIVMIIGYTIGLRNYPEIYYKYLYNPLVLLILICYILLIAKYNIPLGFMLTFSIIVLYYPKIKTTDNSNIMETFENENEDEKINVPVYGEDKNIVDDTKKKNKKEKLKEIKIAEDFKNKNKDEDEDDEDEDDEVKKEKFTEDDDEVKEIGLEKLNPSYYKNKNNSTKNNSTKNNTNKSSKSIKEKKNEKDEKDKKDKESQPQPTKESETFIGDVRQVIKDLDTGRGGMNASNAIKQINNLFYDKHKLNIKKIIETDDDSEEESDDDDFF